MLDYKPREELIALIQRQESELAKSHDENETLKAALRQEQADVGRLTLELAARQPLADSFVAPGVTVDTPEFQAYLSNWVRASNSNRPYDVVRDYRDVFIAHINAHTARAVAAAVEDVLQNMVPLSADGRSVFIDGFGLVDIAWPAAQPVAGELPPLPQFEEAGSFALIGHAYFATSSDDPRGVKLYRPLDAAGVQGDAKPNADCSGDPSCCPDNEGYGCACSQVKPDSGRDAALEDLEQYRVQMAAISTAAIGYWDESMTILPEYDTLALRDVAKLYAKYAALAAHPAPSSDAGLLARKPVGAGDGGTFIVQGIPAAKGPTAEDYSDMLREFFCCYAAGGYNDDGGLVSLERCRSKLAWIVEDQRAHAASGLRAALEKIVSKTAYSDCPDVARAALAAHPANGAQAGAHSIGHNDDLPEGWKRHADGRVEPPVGEVGTAYIDGEAILAAVKKAVQHE